MMDNLTISHQQSGIPISALCNALSVPKATYYRHQQALTESESDRKSPTNAMAEEEKQVVLDLLHSEQFVDNTPYEVYFTLLDQGQYHCSVRTMYRLLQECGETKKRRDERCHRDAVKPELIALRPNEVWSWDSVPQKRQHGERRHRLLLKL